jgi:hypothetical protein
MPLGFTADGASVRDSVDDVAARVFLRSPGLQLFVQFDEELYVLYLVLPHPLPSGIFTGHALTPKVETFVLHFGADA